MQMFTLSASDAPSGIRLPQGEAKDQGTYKQGQGVVEVVKLEGPLAGDLLCVRPGSPAEHAECHQEERSGIRLRGEHETQFPVILGGDVEYESLLYLM